LAFYVNQRRNYARNDFDRTQTFVQGFIYDLPFGNGSDGLVRTGCRNHRRLAHFHFMTIMSGLPLFFTDSGTALKAPGNTQTPDLVAPVQILHGIGKGNPWFSTASFAPAAANTFGNVGRNYLSGPNFFNLDAAISKPCASRSASTWIYALKALA